MVFAERVLLGRTGVLVGRVGLASGYGLDADSIQRGFHEHGVNYLYLSPLLNMGSMVTAVRHLAPQHREELFVVLPRPLLRSFRLEAYVQRWLRKLGLDWVDLLFQDVRKPLQPKLLERVRKLRDRGLVRFFGISSHNRSLLGSLARDGAEAPIDWFHARYNAVHTGAEQDIFPHLTEHDRPGVVIFTATCWRKLLKEKRMPPGERPLTAAECYRFVLSNPAVDVCITAPSNAERMAENFAGLGKGPLDDEEMARIRRIGAHVYRG